MAAAHPQVCRVRLYVVPQHLAQGRSRPSARRREFRLSFFVFHTNTICPIPDIIPRPPPPRLQEAISQFRVDMAFHRAFRAHTERQGFIEIKRRPLCGRCLLIAHPSTVPGLQRVRQYRPLPDAYSMAYFQAGSISLRSCMALFYALVCCIVARRREILCIATLIECSRNKHSSVICRCSKHFIVRVYTHRFPT